MRPNTPKRAKQERQYRKQRLLFLADNPRCQFPGGCVNAAVDIHHRKGRVGVLLTAVEHWSALCRPHHAFLTEHPAIAYEMGMSERRIGGPA